MTLRFRLVASLGVLLTLGLAAFGVGTYGTYARAQWRSLDDQVRSSFPVITRALESPNASGAIPLNPGDPQLVIPPGTYAELRRSDETVVAKLQLSEQTSPPLLPAALAGRRGSFTVGSTDGTGQWRVTVSLAPQRAPGPPQAEHHLVIAVPTTTVERALRRLIVIETAAGLVLLLVLSAGSWLILRRGLRPLEAMANSARRISAGNFDQRVSPAEHRSEVGELGLALNSMLDRIETSFAERDATELKLRRFLADASHELRTPLTSIQGFAELYRLSDGNDRVDLQLVMSRIEDESSRMRRLVEDLLTLARLDETRPFVSEAVDLSVLVADACTDAVALDPGRPVEFDAPAPVVVNGQRDHLTQAVGNLLSNAVHHTPSGSAVDVSAKWAGATAEVTVRDHGPGLTDEALVHVFDRFWQADAARSGKGAGLGLSIVDGIAREHGGSITVRNHPDGGAVFTLRIPVGTSTATA